MEDLDEFSHRDPSHMERGEQDGVGGTCILASVERIRSGLSLDRDRESHGQAYWSSTSATFRTAQRDLLA